MTAGSFLDAVARDAAVDTVNTLSFGLGGGLVRYVLRVESTDDILRDIRGLQADVVTLREEVRQGLRDLAERVEATHESVRRGTTALRRGPLLAARSHLESAVTDGVSPGQRMASLQDARRSFVDALPLLDDPDDVWSAHRQLGLVWVALGEPVLAARHLAEAHATLTDLLDDLTDRLQAGFERFLDVPGPRTMDQLGDTLRDGLRQEAASWVLRRLAGVADDDGMARQGLEAEVGGDIVALRRRYLVRWHVVGLAAQLDLPLDGGYAPDTSAIEARLDEIRSWPRVEVAAVRRLHARARAVEHAVDRLLGDPDPGLAAP